MILPSWVPKIPAEQKIPATLTILLAGKHEGNLDTMILAHINLVKKQVNLLSIPRDIFINGRKLNSAFYFYGIEELERQIGEITGLKIDKYMIIDMYAFIKVVDLIGGLDVYLSEPLIDPTYKTFDNGEWGTLHYEKGTHHLSGVQVLRIARSRHTSSDFSRAERQHSILAALKRKIKALGVGDASRIKRMAEIILSNTTTDISAKEALNYVIRFKDYDLVTGAVLSTFNVLEYEIQTAEPPDETKEEDCYRRLPGGRLVKIQCAPRIEGMYTLIPREDWNMVRWYSRRVLEIQ